MKQLILLGLVVACAAAGLAQAGPSGGAEPYRPAVPRGNTYVGGGGWGGYGGYGAGSTAAGSALSAMSQVISSEGQYNLATSAAAVNMTHAVHNQLGNDMLATETYFGMRAANRAAREQEREPRLTMEQLVSIAREGAPRPMNARDADPVTGGLNWPSALQQNSFSGGRKELDEIFAKRARYGGLTYSDQMVAKQTVDGMFTGLKSQIKQIPPQDYVACRDFLRTLIYSASKSDLR
jgi:hypothetical protein